jgi:hypothetical protein
VASGLATTHQAETRKSGAEQHQAGRLRGRGDDGAERGRAFEREERGGARSEAAEEVDIKAVAEVVREEAKRTAISCDVGIAGYFPRNAGEDIDAVAIKPADIRSREVETGDRIAGVVDYPEQRVISPIVSRGGTCRNGGGDGTVGGNRYLKVAYSRRIRSARRADAGRALAGFAFGWPDRSSAL